MLFIIILILCKYDSLLTFSSIDRDRTNPINEELVCCRMLKLGFFFFFLFMEENFDFS